MPDCRLFSDALPVPLSVAREVKPNDALREKKNNKIIKIVTRSTLYNEQHTSREHVLPRAVFLIKKKKKQTNKQTKQTKLDPSTRGVRERKQNKNSFKERPTILFSVLLFSFSRQNRPTPLRFSSSHHRARIDRANDTKFYTASFNDQDVANNDTLRENFEAKAARYTR